MSSHMKKKNLEKLTSTSKESPSVCRDGWCLEIKGDSKE